MNNVARDYYDSPFAVEFYDKMWGGEGNIHVGLYGKGQKRSFNTASDRTVQWLMERVPQHGVALDLGSGFGGPTDTIRQSGLNVIGLNISEAQNEIARSRYPELVILEGDYADLQFENESFNSVLSIDSLVHAPDRAEVLREAYRVLVPGGRMVFTDLMVSDDAPDEDVAPLLPRIGLPSMGTPLSYLASALEIGFKTVSYEDASENATEHYKRLALRIESSDNSSPEYQKMLDGCRTWQAAGERGTLRWGKFYFVK